MSILWFYLIYYFLHIWIHTFFFAFSVYLSLFSFIVVFTFLTLFWFHCVLNNWALVTNKFPHRNHSSFFESDSYSAVLHAENTSSRCSIHAQDVQEIIKMLSLTTCFFLMSFLSSASSFSGALSGMVQGLQPERLAGWYCQIIPAASGLDHTYSPAICS